MMKKKVLFLIIAAVLCLGGVVSAASMWGTYKGQDIVRLTVDGVPVKVSDAPAINFDSRTMVPIYLLKEAGIQYSWDGANKTVDIIKPQPVKEIVSQEVTKEVKINDLKGIARDVSKYGVIAVKMTTNVKLTQLVYNYNGTIAELDNDREAFTEILRSSIRTDADEFTISYPDGSEFSVDMKASVNYFNGAITADEYAKSYHLVNKAPPVQNNQSNNSSNTPVYNEPPSTPTPNNACQNIRDRHVVEDASFEENHSPFSGTTSYLRGIHEERQASELSAAGC